MRGEHSSDDDAAADVAAGRLLDAELHLSVREEQRVARTDAFPESGIVERDLARVARDGPGRQGEGRAGLEADRAPRDLADPDLHAGEVLEDRDRTAEPLGDRADRGDDRRVLAVGPVREVQARDVHPGLGEAREGLGRPGGRADRADDLGPRHGRANVAQEEGRPYGFGVIAFLTSSAAFFAASADLSAASFAASPTA